MNLYGYEAFSFRTKPIHTKVHSGSTFLLLFFWLDMHFLATPSSLNLLSENRPQMIKNRKKNNKQLCFFHYALPTRQIAPRIPVSLPVDKNLARRSTVSQVWTHTSWLTCQLWCTTVSRTSCKNTQTSAAALSHPKNKLCRIQAGWT